MVSLPQLEGVLNFRELGGLAAAGGTVRHGRLFRSGHLASATDADLAALESLGVATVVDFRLPTDRKGDGGEDRLPEGVEMVSLPMPDPGGLGVEMREILMSGDKARIEARYGDGRAHALATEGAVAQAMAPERQAVYAAFLDRVANTDEPLLFHCSAGKDRAGWAATLLGLALGVSDDDLVEHYLLSNVHRPPAQRQAYYESRGVDVTAIMPFLGVHEDYVRASLAAVDASYESRELYLLEAVGFGPERVDALRAKLLL